ncbi:hypothetical protein K1T71_005843 [Dendrolimus kikuchii]|uniref:Uncharacterized protein n=1 Tax=Dendrolimus kikuchii TaxID=765133 RepID=A0ACC1D654_9NEOP|nr:hypothetical protein K1T71_005843 [Dendrolimus kikuchii]
MTSDFCGDVVGHLSNSQIVSGPGEGAVACRAPSAAMELGRRLLVAARGGDTAAVLELMARGAPFSADWLGTSPLHLAAHNAHADTCAVLLRAGVSRDLRTKVERTPLHLAAYAGHARVVELLLEHDAQVDCRDMLRMTPLHWAAQRGHAAAAAALLRHGADPTALSKFRKTPLALAAAARHEPLVRLLEGALREREAASSIDALITEHMTEAPAPDQNIQQFESIGGGEGVGARLLRQHGITLLPADPSSTVLNALQSGRTVVLSDAGKLMLKESEGEPPAKRAAPSGAKGVVLTTTPVKPAPGGAKGVVLTATPVKAPPRPGVKIFTLNNKLIALPKENHKLPVKKIINPHLKQVKIVQLGSDAKIISTGKATAGGAGGAGGGAPPHRPAVKIFMNKTNFNKLLANSDRSMVENIETEFLLRCSSKYLRTHALAARRALAALKARLDHCQAAHAHH